MPEPGHDTLVIDEPLSSGASTATDTLYLLSPNGPAEPTPTRQADTGNAALDAQIRAYLADGGRSLVLQGFDAVPNLLPPLADAIDLLPAAPGQLVAPEVVTSAELITLADKAWDRNKVALLGGPAAATDAQLITLAQAVIAGTDARGAALFADVAQYPDGAGGTDDIPWAITVAALIARNDRLTGNPNLAAAGKMGISRALGVTDLRSDARRAALYAEQVNTANVIPVGSLRNYGFKTLADLETLPHWWDLSGARTMMAVRARVAAVDEDYVFGQIDAHGITLERYRSAIKTVLRDLHRIGALFGVTPADAYSVETGDISDPDDPINPHEDLAQGEVKAQVTLRTSPHADHITTTLIRRAITAPVA